MRSPLSRAPREPKHMMNSIVANLVAIVVCGTTGGFLGWACTSWLGIDGIAGALVAAFVGTLVATGAFVAIIALLQVYGHRKR